MSLDREVYRPSGRVNWGKLAFWFVLSLPFPLLAGYLLFLALHWGFYVLVLAPLAAGLIAAIGAWMTVALGKCRNGWAGAAVGVAVGLIAFLSYYQFDYADTAGFGQIYRIDRLLGYLQHRAETDEVFKLPDFNRNPRLAAARGQNVALNWFRIVLDGICALLMPAFAGWTRARKPFSEQLQRWFHEHTVTITGDSAREMADILPDLDPDALADAAEPAKANPLPLGNQGQLRLYYIPYQPATQVYLTLSVIHGVVSWRTVPQHLAKMVLLTPEEGAALAERLRPPGARIAEIIDVQPATNESRTAAAATIEQLPADEVGHVLGGRSMSILLAVNLFPLVLGLLVAIGLVVALAVNWSDLPFIGRVLVAGLAFGALAGTLVLCALYADYLPMLLQHRWLVSAIRRRGQALVDPDDPEATYVGMIPRKNWGRLMAENSEDIGFAKIDRARRVLLFEGDRQRWTIPAASIESCEMEEFSIGPPNPKENNLFAVAVLRVNVGGQVWEAPLSMTKVAPRRPLGPERRARARRFIKKVRAELLGGSREKDPLRSGE
jgi:hypothetical protein